jgi:hypothetical protein
VLAKPEVQFYEPESARFIKNRQVRERVGVVEFQAVTVNSQKRRRHSHCDTFVPVQERMILREALPQGGSFLDQVAIVPATRAAKRGLQGSKIPNSFGASEARDEFRVNGYRLFCCRIGSLRKALQQFRMSSNELVGSLQERRLEASRITAAFQIVDKLPYRFLLVRRQSSNNFSKALGRHRVSPVAVFRAGVNWVAVRVPPSPPHII